MDFQEKSLEILLQEIKKRSHKRLKMASFAGKSKENNHYSRPHSFTKVVHKINANRRNIRFFPLWSPQKNQKGKKRMIILAAIVLSAALGWFSPQKNSFSEVILRGQHWIFDTISSSDFFSDFLAQKKISTSPFFAANHQNLNHFVEMHHTLSVNTYAPIISTPELIAPQKLFFANRFGHIFAMNPLNGTLLNRYSLSTSQLDDKKDIIASPLTLHLDHGEKAILYAHSKGGFTALDQSNHYLYRSERGIFEEENIYASPVSFAVRGKKGFAIATMQGSIATFSQQRGTTLWHKTIKGKAFFATPLVDEKSLLLVSVDSSLYKVDLETGRFLWQKKPSLDQSVKSSPIVLHTPLGKKRYVVMSSSGKVGIFDENGKKISIQSLGEPIVASPAPLQKNAAIVGTLAGNVYKISVSNHSQKKKNSKIELFWQKKHASFVSPPVVLPSLSPEKNKDFSVLLADRNGHLFVVDSRGRTQITKALHYHISSTPLVADIDGDAQLDVIVTGEDGHIEIFHLITARHREYLRNLSVSSGFLHFQR